ncbi:MAG: hypothetical protein JJE42_03820 [Burkholderiales bacterium]|nr:hypothetical protein [Burkholderiales bacterium]
MHRRFIAAWTLSIAAAAPLAWAQSSPAGAKPDPQDAYASVPKANYRSSLTDYRAFSDEEVSSWKETNDKVGSIGGWKAYAKEAHEPEPAADSTRPGMNNAVPADGGIPMQGRQGGHKMK